VAHDLGAAFVYAELRPTTATVGGRYVIPAELRATPSGKRVVVVDDAINAGAATVGSARAIREAGGNVVAVAALLVRTPDEADRWTDAGVGVEYLAGVRWNTWPPGDCPFCRAGVPIDYPV
jgi:orotate phosphoribosyltransferase